MSGKVELTTVAEYITDKVARKGNGIGSLDRYKKRYPREIGGIFSLLPR